MLYHLCNTFFAFIHEKHSWPLAKDRNNIISPQCVDNKWNFWKPSYWRQCPAVWKRLKLHSIRSLACGVNQALRSTSYVYFSSWFTWKLLSLRPYPCRACTRLSFNGWSLTSNFTAIEPVPLNKIFTERWKVRRRFESARDPIELNLSDWAR